MGSSISFIYHFKEVIFMNGMSLSLFLSWLFSNTITMCISQTTLISKELTRIKYIIYVLIVFVGTIFNVFFVSMCEKMHQHFQA